MSLYVIIVVGVLSQLMAVKIPISNPPSPSAILQKLDHVKAPLRRGWVRSWALEALHGQNQESSNKIESSPWILTSLLGPSCIIIFLPHRKKDQHTHTHYTKLYIYIRILIYRRCLAAIRPLGMPCYSMLQPHQWNIVKLCPAMSCSKIEGTVWIYVIISRFINWGHPSTISTNHWKKNIYLEKFLIHLKSSAS